MKIRFFLFPLILASQLSVTATGPWGSGVPGSPEMLELEAKWQPMASSPAKMRGHESFNQQKYGMFIHWGLYSQLGGVYKGKKMEEGGVISARTIVLNRKAINLAVVVFLSIRVSHQSRDWISSFQKVIDKHEEIIETHRLTGSDSDYLLKIVASSIEDYDNFHSHCESHKPHVIIIIIITIGRPTCNPHISPKTTLSQIIL